MEAVPQTQPVECDYDSSTKVPQRPVGPKPAGQPRRGRRTFPPTKSHSRQAKQDQEDTQCVPSTPRRRKSAEVPSHQSVDVRVEDTTMLGRKVCRCIGKGAFGQVYGAIELRTGEKQVIKVIENHPNADKEAVMLGSLPIHPHIIQQFQWVKTRRHVYIFLQYGGSQNVDQVLRRQIGQRFEIDTAVDLFHDVAQAVVHLHHHGMCHLDIKPENMMMGDDGVVRLSDFGTSEWIKNPLAHACGSLPFTAPEVLEAYHGKGKGPTYWGDLADCFSMGVLLFEFCFGYNSLTEQLGLKGVPRDVLLEDANHLAAHMRNVLSERHIFCKKALQTIPEKLEHEEALLKALTNMLDPVPSKRSSLEDTLNLED